MPNRIEEWKASKDGLDVLPDLYRYAATGAESIPDDDLERLKWYGLFHRKATPGFFMLRLRIPNGVLSSEQIAAVGRIANDYGRGQADLTTRQNLQLRWIRMADAPAVLQRLYAAGLTAQQSGMDNVRNVVGCPLAGLTADEILDARPLAQRLQQAIVGERAFSNLPRKFNISITGCREDCAHAQSHDLSFTPAQRDGVLGFHVWLGGALGGSDPRLATPLDAFIFPTEVVEVARAVLTVFRDHGPRELRKRARLKVLLADWGEDRFRAAVEAELGRALPRGGSSLTRRSGGDHIGVTRQSDGAAVVGLLAPVGRLTGDELVELGRLAARYGSGEVRLTVQQNVLLPGVMPAELPRLRAEPLLGRLSPSPSPWLRGLVACTGIDYCHYSLIDTKGEALALSAALAARYELRQPLRVHWSGCPHACGQHRLADVGLEGARVRRGDAIVPAASVFVGGRLGDRAQLGEERARKQPVEELADVVVAAIREARGSDAVVAHADDTAS